MITPLTASCIINTIFLMKNKRIKIEDRRMLCVRTMYNDHKIDYNDLNHYYDRHDHRNISNIFFEPEAASRHIEARKNFNTLKQKGCLFADETFSNKIFLNDDFRILIWILLQFVPSNKYMQDQNLIITELTDVSVPPWWRHQMETFSSLLALCSRN